MGLVALMSSFFLLTKHPETGQMETAQWLDDYFGWHRYGVRFPDGKVFREAEIHVTKKEPRIGKRNGKDRALFE